MGVNEFSRLIRVFRLVRAIKSISMISHAINENKASTSLHFMVLSSLMMMLFGSIYILYLEKDMPGANIHNAGDAFGGHSSLLQRLVTVTFSRRHWKGVLLPLS